LPQIGGASLLAGAHPKAYRFFFAEGGLDAQGGGKLPYSKATFFVECTREFHYRRGFL
jgi:hypothetical protein